MTLAADRADRADRATAGGSDRDAWDRAGALDRLLGDPHDDAGPAGLRALLDAERRGEPAAGAEEVLDAFGLGAEFVPVALGGRLERADGLAAVLAPVFRRDLSLGFGHGITSLFAASPVWAAGSAGQRDAMARLLCGGGRAAIVHHALAQGNALLSGEINAAPAADGTFVVGGRKDAVMNADRAGLFTVYARTAPRATHGPGTLSVLLLDPSGPGPHRTRLLPHRPTAGLRACRVGGLELDGRTVPRDALVGAEGQGMRLALQTFQLSRALIPAALTAGADTVLRAAARAAVHGTAGGPGARQTGVLVGVLADLLLCDSLVQCALRALHLTPRSAHLTAACVKYLVPELLRDALEELSAILAGPGRYAERGAGQLAKLLRDMPAAGLGHAGTATCQAVIVPQLPRLAARSWFRAPEPAAALFTTRAELPPLDLGALAVAGGDDLTAALTAGAGRLSDGAPEGPYGPVLRALADALNGELAALRDRFRALAPDGRPLPPGPVVYSLADRYATVVAAGIALSTWQLRSPDGSFTAHPAWLTLALQRLARRLGTRDLPDLPAATTGDLRDELLARLRTGRAYDLGGARLAGEG
ncbi:acyl-CoA dehydrogenase [Streptomyces sp. CA-249302]|uniref:acyl-CoA dehydrogenase n=1 Tax=Streptomyces sp. CA-249302 TaxID=3240058 RepID=UPI003D9381FD